MSDSQDEVDRPAEATSSPQQKEKRQLSQKQLDNLSKAREKAKVVLAAKRERTQKLRKEEKKLKQLKMKDREDKVAAEMRLLQSEQDQDIKTPKPILKNPEDTVYRRKKKPKVVYYSSSSSEESSSEESSSEEEIQHRRRPRPTKAKRERMSPIINKPERPIRPRRLAPQPSAQSENEDAMLEHQYQLNMRKMKREMIMKSVFPTG
jgi:hypothetical protein